MRYRTIEDIVEALKKEGYFEHNIEIVDNITIDAALFKVVRIKGVEYPFEVYVKEIPYKSRVRVKFFFPDSRKDGPQLKKEAYVDYLKSDKGLIFIESGCKV